MKILSFLLVLAMLLSFAACGTDPVEPDDTGDGSEPADTMPAETTADPLLDNLPEVTYDGDEIHIWIDGTRYLGYNDPLEYVEGDVVDDAIVSRNETVASRFDVVFNFDRIASGYRDQGAFRQSILGGDEYDLVEGVTCYQCPLAMYGCYTDLAKNDYIDLEKVWWIPYATDSIRIGERQYMATGFWDFQTILRTQAMFFNANMVEQYRLGNLYDLVENDEWTWDKMIELGEKVADDVNQDGIYNYMDRYGVGGRWDFWMSVPSTAGYQFVSEAEDGTMKVTGLTDELLQIHAKLYPYITQDSSYWSSYTKGVDPKYDSAKDAEKKEMFCNDRILFLYEMMSMAGSDLFRQFGAYGILPTPKFLESQTYYGSPSTAHASAICVTTGDYECSSIVLEALQAESYKQLRPAYFETALSKKYLNDAQSVEMMDLIFTNVTCDFTYNYSKAGIGGELSECVAAQANLGSFFASNIGSMNEKLQQFMSQVEQIPEFEPEN